MHFYVLKISSQSKAALSLSRSRGQQSSTCSPLSVFDADYPTELNHPHQQRRCSVRLQVRRVKQTPDPRCCRCRRHVLIISFFTQSFKDFIILLQHAPPLASLLPLQRNVWLFFSSRAPLISLTPFQVLFSTFFYEKKSHQIKIR